PVASDAMSGRWNSIPPRSLPVPLRPPVENCTIMSGQCARTPSRKRPNRSGSDVVVPSSLRTCTCTSAAPASAAPGVDSISSATLSGTAGFSFSVGTEPVIATVMMHGVLMRFRSCALTAWQHSRPAPFRKRRRRPPACETERGGYPARRVPRPERSMPALSLAQANKIIAKALEKAREMKIKPVSVVVLDDGGHLKAMQREDGASMFRFDVATGKAWAAVAMGASSRALAGRAKDNPNFFVTLAATAHGKFLPQTGGVLIRDASGAIVGAAGASGGTGDEDEAVCAYGIEQAGFTADAKP